MSIVEVTPIQYRKFSGWEEPQFPSGYWIANARVTGDGTAGDMLVQANFSEASGLRNSQYYSLEEISLSIAQAASETVRMAIVNFDLGAGVVNSRQYTLVLVVDQILSASLEPDRIGALLGTFLGDQISPNTAMAITMGLDNVSGVPMDLFMGGYVWSARSTNVPGGPQRPPTGLYRS